MIQANERRQFRISTNLAARGLFIAIMALTVALLPPAAQAKDRPEETTQVFQHTYDEVFQASLDAIERMGLSITDSDKDKGTISGKGKYTLRGATSPTEYSFDIHIETLNTKPEVRVTINTICTTHMLFLNLRDAADKFNGDFASEVHKVLATYH